MFLRTLDGASLIYRFTHCKKCFERTRQTENRHGGTIFGPYFFGQNAESGSLQSLQRQL